MHGPALPPGDPRTSNTRSSQSTDKKRRQSLGAHALAGLPAPIGGSACVANPVIFTDGHPENMLARRRLATAEVAAGCRCQDIACKMPTRAHQTLTSPRGLPDGFARTTCQGRRADNSPRRRRRRCYRNMEHERRALARPGAALGDGNDDRATTARTVVIGPTATAAPNGDRGSGAVIGVPIEIGGPRS